MMSETTANELAEKLRLKLDYDQLTNCMRCGFCLPACPTYRETGVEAESPRGRIALMKAVADGLMKPDDAFEQQMNHCLGCRACEPACPADVKYGQLIEQARDAIEDHTESHRWWVRGVRKIAFKQVFPHQNRMKLVGGALRFYQKSGLQKVAHATSVLKVLPQHLQDMERVLPEASYQGVIEKIGDYKPAVGERIATVGMFRGCIMDVMFTDTNVHTVELLNEAGFDVVIPRSQNCCGALHAHSGERDDARQLAKSNIRAFREAGVDYIVSNAGGCGALLIEYDHLLHDDPEWRDDAAWFASRVIDVSELLVRHGRVPKFAEQGGGANILGGDVKRGDLSVQDALGRDAQSGNTPELEVRSDNARNRGKLNSDVPRTDEQSLGLDRQEDNAEQLEVAVASTDEASIDRIRITYQDSCHLRNVMRQSSAPRKLMRNIAGVEYVEMKEADRCCGSAGIYNITQPEMAGQILEHKMEHVCGTEAQYLLTSNPGCLLQMKLGIDKHGQSDKMQAMHIVDFLHERMVRSSAKGE